MHIYIHICTFALDRVALVPNVPQQTSANLQQYVTPNRPTVWMQSCAGPLAHPQARLVQGVQDLVSDG